MEAVRSSSTSKKNKARKGPKNDNDLKNKCQEHLKIYLFNIYVFILAHIYSTLFHLTTLSIDQSPWQDG